ncbi:MAG: hypothetical protein QOJ10_1622, partial [Chloroflexota bacterium]|nr:hypothetical protein [Chloroflexota bacterium]
MIASFARALCLSLVMVLAASVVASAADSQGAPAAPVLYTVKPGDSLTGIAKTHFGSIDKWRDLYALNRSVIGNNPNRLVVGEVLTLVAGVGRRRPTSTLPGPQVSHSGSVLINAQAASKIKHVFVIMQ